MQTASKASSDHSELINRGRVALSQAEEHIQFFEKYLNQSNCLQHSTNEIVASFGYCKDNVESDDNGTVDSSDSLFQILRPTQLLDQLIRERQDEVEKALKKENFSNEMNIRKISQSSGSCETSQTCPSKLHRKRSFDPTRLYRNWKERVSEEKVQIVSNQHNQFKALPLPGGAKVNSNLYALTKAASGKVNKLPDANERDAISLECNTRIDASILLKNNVSSCSESVQRSPSNESTNRSIKRKNDAIQSKIYEAATNHIKSVLREESGDDSDSESINCVGVEDFETVKGLQLEIARLRADLRCKKLKCISTIHALEQETQSDDVEEILGIPVQIKDDSTQKRTRSTSSQLPSKDGKSFYDRHREWDKMRKDKVQDKREQIEKETLENITSQPQTQYGITSWSEAKNAHDKLLHLEQDREMKLKAERIEKERLNQQKQIEESEKILLLAREKVKALKKNVDKNHQLEYADKLSRSKSSNRNVNEIKIKDHEIHIDYGEDHPPGVTDVIEKDFDKSKNQHHVQSSPRRKKVTSYSKSYADMDDEEFADMIKNIQFQAKKKVRQDVKFRKLHTSFQKKDASISSNTNCLPSPYKNLKQP